jgi:uncharacterized sulfatase
MGTAGAALTREALESGALENNTRIGFADMDASPTKSWLIAHRDDQPWKWHYEFAFGKRPAEELYDLRKDPYLIKNVAGDPAYATVQAEFAGRLLQRLTDAKDPRVTGDGKTFERPPFTDASPEERAGNPKAGRKKGGGKKAE